MLVLWHERMCVCECWIWINPVLFHYSVLTSFFDLMKLQQNGHWRQSKGMMRAPLFARRMGTSDWRVRETDRKTKRYGSEWTMVVATASAAKHYIIINHQFTTTTTITGAATAPSSRTLSKKPLKKSKCFQFWLSLLSPQGFYAVL